MFIVQFIFLNFSLNVHHLMKMALLLRSKPVACLCMIIRYGNLLMEQPSGLVNCLEVILSSLVTIWSSSSSSSSLFI